jgi:NAD(P)-dependent dehydrogenase (short-subunit alcohol dehydrogenase family)
MLGTSFRKPVNILLRSSRLQLTTKTQCAATLSPLERVGLPIDVGRVVCFLASDAGEWVNGKILGVDGGAYR